jgi:hypothetical protein
MLRASGQVTFPRTFPEPENDHSEDKSYQEYQVYFEDQGPQATQYKNRPANGISPVLETGSDGAVEYICSIEDQKTREYIP